MSNRWSRSAGTCWVASGVASLGTVIVAGSRSAVDVGTEGRSCPSADFGMRPESRRGGSGLPFRKAVTDDSSDRALYAQINPPGSCLSDPAPS